MGLEVYYKEDIRRVLLALASAGAGHGLAYIKALHDVALAFGIRAPKFVKTPFQGRDGTETWRVVVGDDGRELILSQGR